MRAGRLYILFLNLLIVNLLQAQNYLAPEVLSAGDGLSSRQVNSLTFDNDGFLWAGTNNGLNRYDGYRFTHFFTPASGNGYPGIHHIIKVLTDESGNIWSLNKGGINRIDNRTGAIIKIPVSQFDNQYPKDAVLRDACSADGNLWILTDRSLTLVDKSLTVSTYIIPPELMSGVSTTCVASDLSRNIWIGTSGGILLYNIPENTFKQVVGINESGLLSNNTVQCLFYDGENGMWAGTQNGLNRIDVDYNPYAWYPGGSRLAVSQNSITDIRRIDSKQLIIASSGGIVQFDESSRVFSRISIPPDIKVSSVTVDSFGNIWAGAAQGIIKIRRAEMVIRNYNSASEGLRLAHNDITALRVYDRDNKLFTGYRNDGFSVADLKTLKTEHFSSIDGSPVKGFYPFKPEEYFVVSEHDIEVYIAGGRRASLFSLYPFMNRELVKNVRINCLFYNNEAALWLGTSDGLQSVRIDSSRHYTIESVTKNGQHIPVEQVYDIEDDAAGNLWLGTENGLVLYNPVHHEYNRYTPYDVNILNTDQKAVYSIASDNGFFWLGTSMGAYRFDLRSKQFTALTDRPEVMNMVITAITMDEQGNIWLGTETGLYVYNKVTEATRKLDISEGLVNESYSALAGDSKGNIYVGGPMGLSVVSPDTARLKKAASHIAITGIRYTKNISENTELFNRVADTITIPWKRIPVIIEFAVLNLSRPELNEYRYSFEKSKREPIWHSLGNRHFILLDRYSPGKYRLNISGAFTGDQVSQTSLIVIVEAPYWRSRLGLGAMVLAAMVLVFLFVRFWIRQFFNLSRENQEREMIARQIMSQKEELTLKNKAITDSINYAKRIQTAMLPPYKLFKSIFPSSFILFMPKDIVSGDFYWVNKVGNRIFVAAVDCTGHGVPGAFMSIIGFELFRKITNIEGLTRPSDILNRLNDDFHEIFKDVDNVVLRDGMDVAFCSIDKKDMILEFAGAFNPLYLIRDNKIMEVKGDRFAIGLDETNFREQTFKNHLIPIQKGDIIYIFSDGFADQFGGPDGKKYKYRRFRHLLLNLHQLPMEKQHEILENNVMEWRGEQDQVDDILVIGIKIDF
ncbi:MAG TPA: two-component regulator propeller domain-containing protein [Bacteroidales bacterium]|nr:two-component regulator propeller domain-containing protein [Bacteroidales bacterium]